MNITVHTPPGDDRVVERRRCTFAGVERLTVELSDGTRLDLSEQDGGLSIRAIMPNSYLTAEHSARATYIGVGRYEEEA